MKLLLGLPIIGLLTACANTNQIARIIDDDSVVKYKNPSAEKLRFQNLYEVKLKDKNLSINLRRRLLSQQSNASMRIKSRKLYVYR